MASSTKLSGFITYNDALKLTAKQNAENHQNFINPGLVRLLGFLNFDKLFVRAENCSVWDSDGNEYIDFLGAYGALNIGHNNSEVIEALKSVDALPNFLQISLNPLTGALASNLAHLCPGELKHSFFSNSGAEAVEGALKLARASSGKSRIVSCEGSFHGKTFGALSVTGRKKYQKPFSPMLPGVSFVPFGNADALRKALAAKDVAAFIVEPIQGEGGIIVPPDGYLRDVRKICSETGTLLIIDEIQTGLGRTGRMFACEYEDVSPDIMCLAKSLGGGIMPLAAYIATEKVWKSAYGTLDKAVLHTSTFGGNTRAVTAGLAALEVTLREDLPGQAEEKGKYFLAELQKLKQKYPIIKEVRGRGLMLGIEFAQPKNNFLNKVTRGNFEKLSYEYVGSLIAGELLNKHHIITAYTLNNPKVIRLEPPLTISYEQIDKFLKALDTVCHRNKGFFGVVRSSSKTVIVSFLKKKFHS